MKNVFFLPLISLLMNPLAAQPNDQFQGLVESWSNHSDLRSATVSFYAIDLASGNPIHNFNGEKAMITASLMKLSTTIAALEILGSDFTFTTSMYHTGYIDEAGVLHGDIILKGQGDPSLGSSRIGEKPEQIVARFAASIEARGIKRVSGNIKVDNTYIDAMAPGTWSWEDIANYYAAVPQTLNFLDNQFSIVFKTGKSGEPAQLMSVSPDIPGLEIVNKVVAADVSGDQTFCFGHPLQNHIEVKGKLPANRNTFTVKGAIPNPGLLFASDVMRAAASLGVNWDGEPEYQNLDLVAGTKLLHDYQSISLGELIRETNQYSVNLYAEALVAVLAKQIGKSNNPQEGLKVIEAFWAEKLKTETKGMRLKDGSGLSHYNTLTTQQLAEMLRFAYQSPLWSSFGESLPMAGQGTLRSFGAGTVLANNLRAKSGYLTGNRGYAGYLNLSSGRKIAFALIVNHFDISPGAMRKMMESLLVEIEGKD